MGRRAEAEVKAAARFLGDAELVDLRLDLDELRREFVALRAELATSQRRSITPSHIELLETLVTNTRSLPSTTAGIYRYLDASGDQALCQALTNAGIEGARGLGWMLRRFQRRPIDGFLVQRLNLGHRDGALWQVLREPDIAADAHRPDPAKARLS
jgi:hypothetical protein